MAELRHKNYTELAEFCRDWNEDLRDGTGKIKDAYKMLSPTVTTALRQFMMEVVGYGVGISGMTAREWFNDESIFVYPTRRRGQFRKLGNHAAYLFQRHGYFATMTTNCPEV